MKNQSRRVRINILKAPLYKTEPDLITTLDVDVRHTRWQKLILPTSIIQDVLDSDVKVLRLRIVCENCGTDINPVLVKRRPRGHRLQEPGLPNSRRGSRKSRRKGRTQRRAPSLPLRHIANKDESSTRSFGDIRDKVKQQRKVHKRRPFLVIHTRVSNQDVPKRKRSITGKKFGTETCAKRPFYVDFRELGWDNWILFPNGYNADYCAGQCDDIPASSSLNNHHSTILHSLMSTFNVTKRVQAREMGFCCSPTSHAPLSIIYLDGSGIVVANIPNMKVEECGCA